MLRDFSKCEKRFSARFLVLIGRSGLENLNFEILAIPTFLLTIFTPYAHYQVHPYLNALLRKHTQEPNLKKCIFYLKKSYFFSKNRVFLENTPRKQIPNC